MFAASCTMSSSQDGAPPAPVAPSVVRALMTDDHDVHIDRDPDLVWSEIKRLYVEGDRYRSYGNVVATLAGDARAYAGGYRADPADDEEGRAGVFRFSDIDDHRRFLAMSIDADGLADITVSHWVIPQGEGARYSVIINAFMPIESADGAVPTPATVADEMALILAEHHEGLVEIMETVKAEIEALPR